MKKLFIFFVTILASMSLLSSCEKQSELQGEEKLYQEIRQIAWDYLKNEYSSESLKTIKGSYKNAVVTLGEYQESPAYEVSFKTTDDAFLGPITVYIDLDQKNVLGTGLRL